MYKNPYIKIKPVVHQPYTEIFLIRHCNPDYSLEKQLGEHDMPLSKFGLKQRKYLTKKLLTMDIDRIYTSDVARARETAVAYAKKSKKRVIIDERLNEINWTDWHRIKYFNMSEKTREKRLPDHAKLDKELERMQTMGRRAIEDLFRQNKGKKVAIFSHGNFIKSIITGILNADILGFLSLEIFQSSISKIIIDRDGYVKLSYINSVDHLPLAPEEDVFITLSD